MAFPRAVPGAVAAALAAVVVVLGSGARAGAQAPPPDSSATVQISDASVEVGAWITVRGEGFSAGALVLVEVCGSAETPDLGCDGRTAIDAEVDRNGSFEVPLHVAAPPADCPCTIRATDDTGGEAASAPIEIAGLPTGTAGPSTGPTGRTALVPEVSVVAVSLTGSDSWTTWFGASPQRTFRYTIRNSGTGPAEGLRIELRLGHDGERQVLQAPPVGRIEAGSSRSFAVSVDLGPFAMGEYGVAAVLRDGTGGEDPAATQAFGATTSSFPWMLVVIPAVVLIEVLLLVTRNRLRDRVQGRSAAAQAAPVVAASAVARLVRTREVGVDAGLVAARIVAGLPVPRPDAGIPADRGEAEAEAPGADGAPEPDGVRKEPVGS